MKTIFKILVIFVVAILVGGMFYGAVTVTSSSTDQSSMSERPARADGKFVPNDGELHGGEGIVWNLCAYLIHTLI